MKTILAAAAIAIGMVAVTIDSAIAQQTQTPAPGQFYGRGPMMGGGWGGGYGPGMMGGYGPGMMGGYGPGMMGGGWGPGAGGGPGFGFGGPFAALDLNAEQREKIARIQEDIRAKNWNTMGQIRTEQFKLRQMYFADNVDASAFAEQQRKVDELRRSMLKSRIENRKEIEAVLTAEQRRQFRSFGPWWLQEEGLE